MVVVRRAGRAFAQVNAGSGGGRLSLPILAALRDIFAVDAAELIPTDAASVGVRKAGVGDRPARRTPTAGIGELRPVRTRILPPQE